MCLLPCWLFLSGFDEISVVVFEAGTSLTVKAEQERKKVAEYIHFHGVNCWKSKCNIVSVCLPRPAHKHKQIRLLVRPRKITSGYGRK